MAKQQEMTAEQMAALKRLQNENFMKYSLSQEIKAQAQNGNSYEIGKTYQFDSPIVPNSYAHSISVRNEITFEVTGTTGSVTPNKAYPYSLQKNVEVNFGNKQIDIHPYVIRTLDLVEGFDRDTQSVAQTNRLSEIDNIVHKVPTNFTAGTHTLVHEWSLDLNNLHPQSLEGLIPIFSSGTRLQLNLTNPSASVGNDPLNNVFSVSGDMDIEVTSGKIDVVVHYRDDKSMSLVEPIQPDMTGLATVQIIKMPSITPLTSGVWQYASFRNSYEFFKLVHIVLDGSSSAEFASIPNLTGYSMDRAENSSSSWFKYGEDVPMSQYYRKHRMNYGSDQDAGVFVYDSTTQNQANVSSKLGQAVVNLTQSGFPNARVGFRVDNASNALYTPRVETFGVLLNRAGIGAR